MNPAEKTVDPVEPANLVYGKYSIKDLVDIDRLRGTFTSFSMATGFTTGFLQYPSLEVLIATGWRDICTKFHRAFPDSAQCCKKSNLYLSERIKEHKQLNISPCENGLVDGAAPVIIKGKLLAYLATGQVMFEPPDLERFKQQARRYGYDLDEYLKAVAKVPVVSEARFRSVLSFLSELAVMIAEQGLSSLESKENARELQQEMASRRSIEAALRETEEKYRGIYENAVEGIFQSTPEGRYLDANPAMASMFGYESPEALMAAITDIKTQVYVNPKRRGEFMRLMAKDKFVKGFEYQVYGKDGGTFWISENARAVRDDQGNIVYYEGFMQDITERKEAEELSRILIMNSPTGVYIIQDKKFQMANRWFNAITGYEDEEILKLDCEELVFPEDLEQVKQKALKMLWGESSAPYEYRIHTKSGETKWIMETVASTQYQGKRATLGFFMDVTEHKQLEKRFLLAQKMEAVGRLAGGVAHDFNNILGAILGYAELMLHNLRRIDPLFPYADAIKQATERAAALTHQLLAFSRKQILQPQVIDLNEVVSEIEKMLHRLIGEDIDLVMILETGLGLVKADPAQVEQIIMNLAVNARDAMPGGGKLVIETANVFLDDSYTRQHPETVSGPYVLLAVSDNGLGMDHEIQAKIFEPFFTTKEPGKGTGLGLATVYGIAKQSGGFVQFYSEVGKGTTFKVYLPRAQEFVKPAKQPQAVVTTLSKGSETILVVEDDSMIRELVLKALAMGGYNLLEAGNGNEALAICERQKGAIHLLLTDVVMPGMNGRELAERARFFHPEMKVIYMSGYTENAVVHNGVLDAAAPLLQKPFSPMVLLGKVRELLDS
jgi:two-component system cell cycle sensor histidine kinase/response regulator CckA